MSDEIPIAAKVRHGKIGSGEVTHVDAYTNLEAGDKLVKPEDAEQEIKKAYLEGIKHGKQYAEAIQQYEKQQSSEENTSNSTEEGGSPE